MKRASMIIKGIVSPVIFGMVSLCIIGGLIVLFIAGGDREYAPREGVWYCEELQIQVSWTDQDCIAIRDGEMIPCDCINDRGSKWIYIVSQAADIANYPLGAEVFAAEHVVLTEDKYVVKEEKTEIIYTFEKIPNRIIDK